METLEYFAPGLSSIDEVEATHGPIMDATALSKIAGCPRAHQIRHELSLTRPDPSAKMAAGIAIHEGLDYYYAHASRTPEVEAAAVSLALSTLESFEIDRAMMDPRAVHLTPEHLQTVMENYFSYWGVQVIDIFQPLAGLHLDDLNLNNVLAAKFQLTPSEEIILGESSLVMRFELGSRELILAGKPDLPASKQTGAVYVMDHKTTSSYLSDWWAKSHEVSNKLRGYQAMIESLLGCETHGAVINGIYVGKYATNPDSSATKFQRFQFDFSPGHVEEALLNQLAWKETIDFYRTRGYFPQGCGYGGCNYPDICRRDPATREEVYATDYVESDRSFWDI